MKLDFAITTVVHAENGLEQLGAVSNTDPRLSDARTPLPHRHDASDLDNAPFVPLGAIIAWGKTLTGTPALPAQFLECNGQTVSDADSPFNGQAVPDLNGANRHLRGNSSSGGTRGSNNHTHTFSTSSDVEDGDAAVPQGAGAPITVAALGHSHPVSGTTASAEHLPPSYDVVWIIRIK